MNRLSNRGCYEIANLLSQNVNIKSINLSSNMDIKEDGMRKVVKAARECKSLQCLDFTYCHIELKNPMKSGPFQRTEGEDILEDLKWNCSLCELKLTGNRDIYSKFLNMRTI